MKNQKVNMLCQIVFVILVFVVLAGTHWAYAAGTASGLTVSSTATVDYTVGGINQPDVLSTGGSFVVDRRINLTVSEVGNLYTDVTPGALSQVLTFTVTNSTNATVDLRLLYTQDLTDVVGPFGGLDKFDTTGISIRLESGATSGFQSGEDLAITFLDDVPADATKTIYIVSNIPSGQANGNISSGTLTAIANSDGTLGAAGDYTETAGADTPNMVDTVFGDTAGDTDIARDGKHSDDDGYNVLSATILVTKTIKVISDPFNFTTNPKAIPGAVIEYCIQVSNSGGTVADTVIVSDPVPANSTFVAGSIFAGGSVTGGVCDTTGPGAGTSEDDDAVGTDDLLSSTENAGNFDAGTQTVTTSIFSVPVSGTTTSRFRVTIN